jgi:bifunctional UDP-N-acetylglucosamine pyrophosphorylase/glucosamine-1-phosphate N-acetyltransferase
MPFSPRARRWRHRGGVIVLFADTPLVEAATLRRLVAALDAGAQIAALGFEAPDATGYGRLLLDAKGRVQAICEHNDASEEERRIGLCNAGAMAFRVPKLAELLSRIANSNAKGEYYLTDVVAIAAADGSITLPASCAPEEALGSNSSAQLAPPRLSSEPRSAKSWRRASWWRRRRCG